MAAVFQLGLTGGIGSGKSTVAAMLAACGAQVLDADALARACTAPGGSAMAAVRHTFGPQAVAADGGMDRAYMRQLAFADGQVRGTLQAIIHPLVGQAIAAALAQARGVAVLDIPLLVESDHWAAQMDAVLVVDCLESTQIARVMARSHWDAATAQAAIAAQASRQRRRAAADWVIFNEGLTLAQLRQEVLSISRQLPL